jgi:hypothetical protein
MTAAQKTAKAKFKQAIAYRTKTGVSLKEAFAHVYGKKVGAAPKKAAKKVVKKAAKKKIGYSKTRLKQEKGITKVLKSTPRTLFPYTEEEKVVKAGKKYFDQKAKELHEKGVSGVKKKKAAPKKRKPISEQSILNKIHKVKDQVNQLDELQHKHMSGIAGTHKTLRSNLENALDSFNKRRELYRLKYKNAKTAKEKNEYKKLLNSVNASRSLIVLHIKEHNKKFLK